MLQNYYSSLSQNFAEYTASVPEMVSHVVLHILYMEKENQIVF